MKPEDKAIVHSRRHERLGLLVLLVIVVGLILLTAKSEITHSGNEASRLAAVQCLIDHGTFAIDNSIFQTVDKARTGGHFYSDKPLLLTMWLSAIYWALAHVFSCTFRENYHLVIYVLSVVGIGSFSVLLSLLFYRRLGRTGAGPAARVLLASAVVWSTWIFSYGTTINNHTPAACVIFALALCLESASQNPHRARWLGAGLLAGVLLNLDLPTGIFFSLGGAYLCARSAGEKRAQRILNYATGFLVPVLTILALNYRAYGSPLPGYLIPGGYDYAENIQSAGFAGLRRPGNALVYLFHILLGQRGLFSHMPVLLFGILALWNPALRRGAFGLTLTVSGAVLVLYYGTQSGDYGGYAYGFRYLIPLIPLLFWLACEWILTTRKNLPGVLFGACILVGTLASVVGAYNPWPAVYDGSSVRSFSVENHVRSPLLANVLCFFYEKHPHSSVTQYLIDDVYGRNFCREYLPLAFTNMRKPEPAARARQIQPVAHDPVEDETLNRLEILLKKHPEKINQRDQYNTTMLHWAAFFGRTRVAELLLAHGADTGSKDSHGWEPLCLAIVREKPEVVKVLLNKGANANAVVPEGANALQLAVQYSSLDMVQALLSYGARVNEANRDGFTPLHMAAAMGQTEIVKVLLKDGADPLARTADGKTALQLATENHQAAVAELLRYITPAK